MLNTQTGGLNSKNSGFVIWLTGLPCSGKTTLAKELTDLFVSQGKEVELLDGDLIRSKYDIQLGFSKDDRDKNVMSVGTSACYLSSIGKIAIVSLVSPYEHTREYIQTSIENFCLVYVMCPVSICAERDVKGMYKKAIAGEIKNFTGVDDPYEPPVNPDVIVRTHMMSKKQCIDRVLEKLKSKGYVND